MMMMISPFLCLSSSFFFAQKNKRWKTVHYKDYHIAYVSLALPSLFEPLVKIQMVRWEPLQNTILGKGGRGGREVLYFPIYLYLSRREERLI